MTIAKEKSASFSASLSSQARRDFIKTGGALVVSFGLAPVLANAATPGATPAKTVALDQVDGFIAIDAKGMVTVFSGKVDLGTGIRTAMAQIAAEELSVSLTNVTVIQGDTLLTPDQGVTYGSLSIQVGGMQIRQAAATARDYLITLGAQKLSADKAYCVAKDGTVTQAAGGTAIPYGDLIGSRNFDLKVDPKAAQKNPKDYSIVGLSVARLDIPDKVTGRHTYMHDFKIKGMLHARVVRPRAMKANLQAFNDWECRKVKGYVGTIRKGNFLGVLARNEWAAIKAARVLDTTWSEWNGLPDETKLWDYVRATKINKVEAQQKVGDSAAALPKAAKTLSASYDFAIHTHGSIGPSCSVAEFADGKLTVWSASQQTHLLRLQLARMLEMKPEDVRCIYIEGSGCYGRNGHEDAAADAALLAVAVGLPVRVQWMRADEHGWDPKGPPTLLDYKGGLDAAGKPLAWESNAYLPDRPKDIAVALVAAELANLPHEQSHPGNIHAALAIGYAVPNVTASTSWLAETPFRPSWIRAPGRMQNSFGNESFLDEMAALAGADPFEYRVNLLSEGRALELMDRLKTAAAWKWQPRNQRAAQTGDVVSGRGVSYIKYENVRTFVGMVADVEVNRKTGKVTVKKVTVAHDCGQIINPDGLKNQIEGNVIQTVSRTLLEQLKYDRSAVTSLDWASYPIITYPDVPQVAIELLDRPNEKPWGAGEPTAALVPSAIANAIFDATGVRLRSVPFTPDKVLAGLKAA